MAVHTTTRRALAGGIAAVVVLLSIVGASARSELQGPGDFFEVEQEYWACSGQDLYSGHYARSGNICKLYVEFRVLEKRNGLLRVTLQPTEVSASRGFEPLEAWLNPNWLVTFQTLDR